MRNVFTPASRLNDPPSSYEAEVFVNKCGERARQQAMVYELVLKHPNCTSDELADFSELNRHQIARRLPEVETAGLIERGTPRKSTKSGRSGVTWHPKVKGQLGLL